MASLSFVIGIIGNVISLLVFTSPIKTFRQVVKKKSTEEYKSVPYITTLLSTSLWTFYGLLKPGGFLVVTVNGAGAVFQLVYVVLFLIYAPKPKKVETAKLAGLLNVGFVGVVIVVTLVGLHGSLRLTFTGVVCCALTIGMYASPLAAMRTVMKTECGVHGIFGAVFLVLKCGRVVGLCSACEGHVHRSSGVCVWVRSADSVRSIQEEKRGRRRGIGRDGRSLPKPSVHKIVENGGILYHK